jgi:hypothetical protein
MTPISNLPAGQRDLQRRVDQWNADEALWRKLEPKHRLRRKMLHGPGKRQLRELDLREHAAARPPEDCIGWLPTRETNLNQP